MIYPLFVRSGRNIKTEIMYGAKSTRVNEPTSIIANIDKLKKIGWNPKYDVKTGISITIKDFIKNESK